MSNQILLRVSQEQADRIQLVRRYVIELQRKDYRTVRELIGRYPRWSLSYQDILLYCLGYVEDVILKESIAKADVDYAAKDESVDKRSKL
jgi:hypothetical protein